MPPRPTDRPRLAPSAVLLVAALLAAPAAHAAAAAAPAPAVPPAPPATATLPTPAFAAPPTSAAATLGTMPPLEPSTLFPGARFAPQVPTLAAVVGIGHAERPLTHAELLRYLEALAAASPRARLMRYATTHEGRPMLLFAVSDEATIADLEGFRQEHARRADPRGREAAADAALAAGAKAVAVLAYGIHGDELSSTDAAAAVAYWLVAGEDDETAALRRSLVVLIEPNENPDGRDRVLAMTRAFAHRTPVADAEDLSQTALWPRGRGNHYLFDLNRDWFTLVQPESARSGVLAAWHPQLLVDSHEMGWDDSYLFSPPRHPFNPLLPPGNAEWRNRYAADQARALDRKGYPYYTREWNEEFFPGYGSSWISYTGATGVLYEMSRTAGTAVRQRGGNLRTFPQAVEHQVISSAANLRTLAANRPEALLDYWGARREGVRRGATGPVRAWILPAGRDPQRTDRLARVLQRQGIEVRRLAAPVRLAAARSARDGASQPLDLSAGSWMVPLHQPAHFLARVLLDPHIPMSPEFLREEREHLEREKGTRLYDTTAWSLPMLHGVDAWWVAEAPAGDWRAEEVPPPAPGAVVGTPGFGWVVEGAKDSTPPLLAELLQRGLAVRVAEKPFRVAGRSFSSGSLLVPVESNRPEVAALLAAAAARHAVEIVAVPTAKSEDGPDLGGNHFFELVPPRVGVLAGPATAATGYGALWHTLDVELGLRFTAVDSALLRRLDLARYNVLVVPPADAAVLKAQAGKDGLERLRRWVEAGGTLVGVASGAEFVADKDWGLTRTRWRADALDRFAPPVWGVSAELAVAGGKFRATGLELRDPKAKEGATAAVPSAEAAYRVAPILGPGARPFAPEPYPDPVKIAEPVALSQWIKPLLPTGSERAKDEDLARGDERLRRFMPSGSLLAVDLDSDEYLAWGIPATTIPMVFGGPDTLVAERPVAVVGRFAGLDRIHLGGLLWPEGAARLAQTAFLTREAVGRGQVILFADEPTFRGWLGDGRRLLANALLLGPGVGTRWSAPW